MCHLSADSGHWVPAFGTSVIGSAASISSSTYLQALASRNRLAASAAGATSFTSYSLWFIHETGRREAETGVDPLASPHLLAQLS